jgi:hypothetical protein
MSDVIKLCCPRCNMPVRSAPLMTVATLAIDRTCRRCKITWRLIVKPLKGTPGKAMHLVEWTARMTTIASAGRPQ